ncbi:MAG: hypothetical protein ACYTEQ_09670 [Planctomycetota bacterium]
MVAECIDCHLTPRDDFFKHMATKLRAGLKDICKRHFGRQYDSDKMDKKVLEEMPNERCLNCHRNLLTKPTPSAARITHQAVLYPTDPALRSPFSRQVFSIFSLGRLIPIVLHTNRAIPQSP